QPRQLGKRQRHDGEIERPEFEFEADAADDQRDQNRKTNGGEQPHPERHMKNRCRQGGDVRRNSERRGVEHRKLSSEAEDQVETYRGNCEYEAKGEDRKDKIALDQSRNNQKGNPEQRLHRSPPNSPEGWYSRIATTNIRPKQSRTALGRKRGPPASVTPRIMPPASEPMSEPMPPRMAASIPFRI